MKAKFNSKVYAKEPNVISQEFGIKLNYEDKKCITENNKFSLKYDIDNGEVLPKEIADLQN